MPDSRRHRGPAPEDAMAFAPTALPALRSAVADLVWLLDRGYAPASSLALVGDRHGLTARQRAAVSRCLCATANAVDRRRRQALAADLGGRELVIDGFNVLTTLETALAGGPVLLGCDGVLRDIAGVHGTHRLVEETTPALELLAAHLAVLGVAAADLLFDRPVSNSGRTAGLVNDLAAARGWALGARVVDDPDRAMIADGGAPSTVVATADGAVLDRCGPWYNLARGCVAAGVPGAHVVDLAAALHPPAAGGRT